MSRRVALVVNPTSGRGRGARNAPVASAVLRQAGLEVTEYVTASAFDVVPTLEGIKELEPDAVVVVGGDGSVHLTAQHLAQSGIPLGIIPSGTGNDFAAGVGIPTAPRRSADLVVAGTIRDVDLIRSGRTWITSAVAAGFDAAVNARANALRFPRGGSRYTVATLAELRVFDPISYTLTVDGEEQRLDAMLVSVGNVASYGGGLRMFHGAEPDDGLLDVTIIEPVSRLTLLRMFAKLSSGAHTSLSVVKMLRAEKVRIDASGVVAYADGERFGELPVELTCVPGALRVFAPAG